LIPDSDNVLLNPIFSGIKDFLPTFVSSELFSARLFRAEAFCSCSKEVHKLS
jgi:hypothetical protein